MFQGLDHVSKAVQILVSRNATLNQRLYEAACEFSAAMRRPDQWPADLLERARGLQRKLTAKGRIDKTVNGMDAAAAGRIATEIFDLSVAISAASIHEMRRQVSQMKSQTGRLPIAKSGRTRRLDVSRAT